MGHWLHRNFQGRPVLVCGTERLSAADAVVQSEEARIEFDKEPGHDKLKVSGTSISVDSWQSDIRHRRRPTRC